METAGNTGNPTFNKWVQEHGTNYVAHATENVEVLRAKVLKSAEEILREQKQVESESGGMSSRGVTKIADVPASKSLNLLFFRNVSKKRGTITETIIYPKFSSEALVKDENFDPEWTKLKDKGHYFTYKQFSDTKPSETFKPRLRESTLRNQATEARSIETDENQGRPVDQQLRKIYTYVLKKGVASEQAVEQLSNLRKSAFNTQVTRLENMLSISKNQVWWSYGPIAILIGKPEGKVASDETLKELYQGGESRLKAGFQVSDGFYNEKLTNDENMIMGPKYLLDQYRNDPKIDQSVKDRFVDIESLSKEQWPLFGLDEERIKEICTPPPKKEV